MPSSKGFFENKTFRFYPHLTYIFKKNSAWRKWMREAQDYNPQPRAQARTTAPRVTTAAPQPQSALELALQGLRRHRQLVSDAELQTMLDPKHPSHQFGLQMQAERQAMLEKVKGLRE